VHIRDGERRRSTGSESQAAILDRRQVPADAVQPTDVGTAPHQGLDDRALVGKGYAGRRRAEHRRAAAGEQDQERLTRRPRPARDRQRSSAGADARVIGQGMRCRNPLYAIGQGRRATGATHQRDADPRAQCRQGRRCHRPRRLAGRDDVHACGVRIESGQDSRVRESRGDECPGIDGLDGRPKDVAGVAPKKVVRVRQ
jgi:hypothetical protein